MNESPKFTGRDMRAAVYSRRTLQREMGHGGTPEGLQTGVVFVNVCKKLEGGITKGRTVRTTPHILDRSKL